MLNEDIAADLRAKAQRGEPGFEANPHFVPSAESANADINKWRNARVSQNGELSVYAIADFVKGLHDYMGAVHRCAVDHGWWEEGHRNFGEMLMLMTSELAEALEAYREGDNVQQIRYEYPNGEGNERTVLYEPQFVYTDGHTELGKPVGVAPVAPLVSVYWMLVMAVLIQSVWASVPTADVSAIVTSGLMVIVPVAVAAAQPPDVVTV